MLTMHPARRHETELLMECDFVLWPSPFAGVEASEYLFARKGVVANKRRTWGIRLDEHPLPRVCVVHRPTAIRSHDSDDPLQWPVYPSVAFRRLRLHLAVCERSAARYPASGLWQEHREGRCIYTKQKHRDYPALLAEAMDALHFHAWRYSGAADHLGVWWVQIIRFVCKYRPAKQRWNQELAAQDERLIQFDSRRHRSD